MFDKTVDSPTPVWVTHGGLEPLAETSPPSREVEAKILSGAPGSRSADRHREESDAESQQPGVREGVATSSTSDVTLSTAGGQAHTVHVRRVQGGCDQPGRMDELAGTAICN
jgi:hypothetical protein